MFNKNFLIFLSIFFFIFNSISYSIENKIIVKIEDQIITSLDVKNEYKYLVALNPNLKNSKKEEITELSKRSITQEKIKQLEIKKVFKNTEIPKEFLERILKNVYSKIGIKNLNDFKKYLRMNDINFENVKNKLETEALWNQLIVIKYSSKVKIDKENIKKKITEKK